jgi:hypothetical protein
MDYLLVEMTKNVNKSNKRKVQHKAKGDQGQGREEAKGNDCYVL